MAILIGVLILTALGIAAAGFLGLRQVDNRIEHLTAVTSQDSDLCTDMRLHLLAAIRAQKNAVLSDKDEGSRGFVLDARNESGKVDSLYDKLVKSRKDDQSMELR